MDRCKGCGEDLGNKLTITAIFGELICNSCAAKKYSARKLQECAEEVAPADIGIESGGEELAKYEAELIEELENRPETQLGYRQQDLIDMYRREQ